MQAVLVFNGAGDTHTGEVIQAVVLQEFAMLGAFSDAGQSRGFGQRMGLQQHRSGEVGLEVLDAHGDLTFHAGLLCWFPVLLCTHVAQDNLCLLLYFVRHVF